MKERPILFSGEMVRAILDGRKTQTRRVVKPQPIVRDTDYVSIFRKRGRDHSESYGGSPEYMIGHVLPTYFNPYGVPGDRLWVRETWGTVRMHELGQHVYRDGPRPDRDRIVYRVGTRVMRSEDAPPDYDPKKWPLSWADDMKPDRWRPSIHMPRWASRLTLEITEVRVERLADCTEADARAEGCPLPAEWAGRFVDRDETALGWFRNVIWNPLNVERGYGWEVNPWVWVISFKRAEQQAVAA